MIKTTHPIHYGAGVRSGGGDSIAATSSHTSSSNHTSAATSGSTGGGSNDPCSPNCGSGLGGGICSFFNNLMCSFTGTAKGIADTAQSGDKIAKMLPMAFVLIMLGLAVGFSKGKAISIGR